ncbi:MAG: hypothetical protein K8R36_16920 [Planctomycetales bacterium]|nr:hypothetical protein [Planctomycetales bacterium]
MDLQSALSQISDIRHHAHRGGVFRGYRALTTAFSGVVALAAARTQEVLLPHPERSLELYLYIWLSAGLVCIVAAGVAIFDRCRRSGSAVQRDLAVHAVEQLVPSLVAGGLLTFVLVRFDIEMTVLLPGLWAIFLSLGVFSSRRLLPRATAIVGGYYLLAGLLILAEFPGVEAFSPWVMGITFGLGQLLAAAVLWWTLERPATEVANGTA